MRHSNKLKHIKSLNGFTVLAIAALFILGTPSCKNKQTSEEKLRQLELSENKLQDTSKIIYLSHDREKQNLYIMNEDGSEQRQLTNTGFSVQWPSWSPDGKYIVFNSYDDGYFGIYIIDDNGENMRKLSLDVEVPDIPCWSDDSKKIAFMAERSEGIQITDLNGNIMTSVGGDGVGAAYQRWSPAGSLMAFESGRDGNAEVYSIDAISGEGLKRLTENDVADEWPNFSWDGSMIAWARGVEGNMNVWVMNSDGSGQRQLTKEILAGDGHASFSPDGSRLVFTSWSGENPSIYTIKLDGSGLQKIAEGSNPCWSPF
jgi:TolB protein